MLQVDGPTGLCTLYDSEGKSSWAVDRMQLHVYTTASGQRSLYKGEVLVGDLDGLRSQHDIASASLVREPGLEKIMFQVTFGTTQL